jgi:hypothetical protein
MGASRILAGAAVRPFLPVSEHFAGILAGTLVFENRDIRAIVDSLHSLPGNPAED